MTVTSRLHNLDYLRGLAASSIMFYHFTTWSFGEYDADTLIRRIGIYGVAIFYVLSGLTLYHVYFKKLFITETLPSFFKKRVLRIFPLLWLATLATIVLNLESPDITKLALNLSGLFGLVAWDKYFAVGAWSIGNELVFYLLFPFFIIIARYSKMLFLACSLLFLVIYIVFAFQILDPSVELSMQWKIFDFASTSSNAQAAYLNYLSKNSELSYAKYKAKASFKNAQNSYKTSLAKIEAAKAKLQASEMTYELIKKKFQQGIVNNVSYLDALSDKFNSNSQLQTALNEVEYQKAVLLYEMGENIKGAIQ